MTKSMKKLYFLVERCFELREPVLLVGETGGGKTTVCQLLSACLQLKLHILNCHQYTETSDFIGVGSFMFFLPNFLSCFFFQIFL
jgi:midasin